MGGILKQSNKADFSSATLGKRKFLSVSLVFGVVTYALLIGWFVAVWNYAFPAGFSFRALVEFFRNCGWAAKQALLDWEVYVTILLLSVLAFWHPARSEEKVLSKGLAGDFFYYILMAPFFMILMPIYHEYLNHLYGVTPWLQKIKLHAPDNTILLLILGGLLADFLGWFHHMIRHKIRFCWHFHAIHHAQKELNPMTVSRLHPIDWLIAQHIQFLPVLFLTNSVGITIATFFFMHAYDKFIHSNVRTNLGIFRYIFLSPQAHRVHHSSDPAHFNTNFSTVFSIWDRAFGTYCKDEDIYPETGEIHSYFPYEQDYAWWKLPQVFLAQMIYPIAASLNIDAEKVCRPIVGKTLSEQKQSVATTPGSDGPDTKALV